jgi:hypothetical protein
MSLEIKFITKEQFENSIPEPIPAYKTFPEWFSNLPNSKSKCPFDFVNNINTMLSRQVTSATIKTCPGVKDFLNMGYIIPSWEDFVFRQMPHGELLVNWLNGKCHVTYDAHSESQYVTMPNKPIYGHFGKILTDAKILQKTGAIRSVRYNWIGTVEPNLQMAKRVYEEVKKIESIKNTKRRTKENPVVATFDKRKNNGGKSTKTNGVDMRKKEYRDIPKVGLIRTFLRWIY